MSSGSFQIMEEVRTVVAMRIVRHGLADHFQNHWKKDVVTYLDDMVHGSGGDMDWDDFTKTPIS